MKVLHVISDQNIGGAGVLLCNLLRHFDGDIESCVALPRGSALEARISALGISVIDLDYPCDRVSVRSVREIGCAIRKSGAELLHANAALCARIAGRIAHLPIVHTRHCCYPPRGAERLPILKTVQKQINRCLSDRVIATADAAAEDLFRLGIPREKIRVIINGSDAVREVSEAEKTDFRNRFSLKSDDFLIGICARLESCKGQDTFLYAAREILQRMPNRRIRFLIVGTGSKEKALRALSERLGISYAVRFTGFVSDMAPVYRLLRINVNCSRGTETSCLSLSEGMSAGIPSIVSNYGGNPSMIGSSQAGFLYPVEDWRALADGICQIVQDESVEKTMREAARARFEGHYTAKRMAEEVGTLYRELLTSNV